MQNPCFAHEAGVFCWLILVAMSCGGGVLKMVIKTKAES